MGVGIEDLDREVVREALRLWGSPRPPANRAQALRLLREALGAPGAVRALLDRGPAGVRDAFATLATGGPQPVDVLLDRGWWGRGTLPPPLDWLQRRALVAPVDGVVHPVDEARAAFLDEPLPLPAPAGPATLFAVRDLDPPTPARAGRADAPADPSPARPAARPAAGDPDADPTPAAGADPTSGEGGAPPRAAAPAADTTSPDAAGPGAAGAAGAGVRVEGVGCVVVVATPEALHRVLTAPGAGLRGVAPTVAVSDKGPAAVSAALRAAGIDLAAEAVAAEVGAPALPLVAEEAVGPRAVRALLERAVEDGRQVRLRYFASSRGGAATDRVVDPWSFRDDLLRGWCHLRVDERTFALDRIGLAHLLPSPVDHPAP